MRRWRPTKTLRCGDGHGIPSAAWYGRPLCRTSRRPVQPPRPETAHIDQEFEKHLAAEPNRSSRPRSGLRFCLDRDDRGIRRLDLQVLEHLGNQGGDRRAFRPSQRHMGEQRVPLESLDDGGHAVVPADAQVVALGDVMGEDDS